MRVGRIIHDTDSPFRLLAVNFSRRPLMSPIGSIFDLRDKAAIREGSNQMVSLIWFLTSRLRF